MSKAFDKVCNPNLFADDVSLNTVMYDLCTNSLSNDLKRLLNGRLNRKWSLILTPPNPLRK